MKRSTVIGLAAAGAIAAVVGGAAGWSLLNGEVRPRPVAPSPQAPPDPAKGKLVYEYWCSACHGRGPGHPGTQSLEVRYQGAMPAVLEDRTDLSPEAVAHYVRNGSALMPFFRKTEISDADLRDMGAWLARDREEAR